MRALLVVTVLSLPAFADDVASRAEAAKQAAGKRGAIPVVEAEAGRGCFVPKFLDGEKCAEGLRLCVEWEGQGSCDGYSRTTTTLRVEYENEPPPRVYGAFGARPGMPYAYEAGYSVELEIAMSCDVGSGVAVVTRAGLTPEAQAAEEARAKAEAKKRQEEARARCEKAARARVEKDREWQRCELLAVDACRREAFLRCRGNALQRGLVRASWSRPKDAPASETLKVQVLPK